MHFHLPKPLHGWREFAGEVGIIVVGVLIALGAEQVVESIHLQSQTQHARRALGGEVDDAYVLATERGAVHDCLNAQIDRLEAAILDSRSTLAPVDVYSDGAGSYVYRAPSRPWSENVWDNVRGEEVFASLPEQTRQELTNFYTQLAYMQRMNDEEDNTVGTAMVLGKPVPLDASVKSNLIELLENERRRNDLMALIASQMIRTAEQLGDKPPTSEVADYRAASGTLKFCRSHRFPA